VLPSSAGARVAYVTGSEEGEVIVTGASTAAAPDSGNYVVPVDLSGETVGAPIYLGGTATPLAIAITPDGATAYAAYTRGDRVFPIDTATNTAGPPIVVGDAPEAIAITPDGTRAYVANYGSNTITRIDLATGATTTIPGDGGPSGVAITPDGTRAYVTNYNSDTVTPIDLATDTPGATIPVGEEPWGLALTPDGARAYVADTGEATVTPIDLASNTPETAIAASNFPQFVAITPDGARAYVTSGPNPITPIDIATDAAESGIATSDRLTGLAILPDGSRVYFTDHNAEALAKILLPGNTLVPAAAAGEELEAIAIVPNQPPHAAFSSTATPELGVAFDASGSTDSDGSVARYDWDFGDGDTAANAGASPNHTYAQAGTYQVTLTETDNEGCSLDFVFTGQTAYCNGSNVARVTHTVTVGGTEAPKEEVKAKETSSCLPVGGNASSFVPKLRSSHVVPGVRVKLAVNAPAHLAIESVLVWSDGGKTSKTALESISVDINQWRRIRIPIPTELRDKLPLGTRVGLKMQIQAAPHGGSGCTGTVTQKRLRVRVVRVIPDAVQAQ
jgi:YVTN family beta-propeller protein